MTGLITAACLAPSQLRHVIQVRSTGQCSDAGLWCGPRVCMRLPSSAPAGFAMANSAQYSRGSSFDSLIANLRVINNHRHQASDLSVSVVGSSNKWWPDQQPSHHGMYACCLHRGPASPQPVQGGQHMPQAVGLRCRSASCPPTAAALRSEDATQLLLGESAKIECCSTPSRVVCGSNSDHGSFAASDAGSSCPS